ncbi:MAG: hypothetical protein LBE91_04325, partial [Tannerella sp.]|nr:hypothetical protein [Tannerella sp.]
GFTDFSEEETAQPASEETPEIEEVTEVKEEEKEEAKPNTTKKSSIKTASKRKDEPKSLGAKAPQAAKPKATTKAAAPRKSTVGTKRGG